MPKSLNEVAPTPPDDAIWSHIEPESSRRLLLSALAAFSVRGYNAATTREIGEGAGMSPAAVYTHYGAKHDLLFEVSRVGHLASLDTVKTALGAAPDDDPVTRLRAFIFSFAKWHADNHELARVIQYEFKHLPEAQLGAIMEVRQRIQALMEEELTAGVASGLFVVDDVWGVATAALSLCIGIARWYQPSLGRGPEHIAALYATLVLRMVSAPV